MSGDTTRCHALFVKTYLLKPIMTLDNLNIPAGPLKPGVVSNSPQDRAAQRLVDRIAPEPLAAAIDLTERAVLKTLPARQPLPVPVLYPDKPSLKLGLDVHLEFIMAVVQRDHAAPQAPRKFTLEQLLLQVQKWVAEGVKAAQKMKAKLAGGTAMKKKTVIALARQLAIDLWRWRTGRCTMADLGWVAA